MGVQTLDEIQEISSGTNTSDWAESLDTKHSTGGRRKHQYTGQL